MSDVATQHDPLAEAQAIIANLKTLGMQLASDEREVYARHCRDAVALIGCLQANAAPPERILKWRRDFGDARTRAVSVFDDEGTPLDYVIDYAGPDDEWLLTLEGYPQTRGTLIECMDYAERSERASRDRLKDNVKATTV